MQQISEALNKKLNAYTEVGNKTVWIILKPHSTGGRPKSVLRNCNKVCSIMIKNSHGGSIFYGLSTVLKSLIPTSVKLFSILTEKEKQEVGETRDKYFSSFALRI